ncbi:MAG: hypothetical protein SGI96_16065 [Bacteroidota bacterium]|nr:hypothetical protein [Bacteroidota bacterium]
MICFFNQYNSNNNSGNKNAGTVRSMNDVLKTLYDDAVCILPHTIYYCKTQYRKEILVNHDHKPGSN